MIELGQLEARHADFDKRNVRVFAVSPDNLDDSKGTQEKFPHLTVIADKGQNLAKAVEVVHPHMAPDGGDTNAPTTFLVDGAGTVRWTFRPERFIVRLSPDEVLSALDQHVLKQ
jgi:peroxiredoxin